MRNPLLKEHYFKVEFPESGLLLNLYQKKQEPKKTANKSRKKGVLGSFDKLGIVGKESNEK